MRSTVTDQIIEAIAEIEDTKPEDIDMILQHYVSTDAIRDLVAHDGNAWQLQFETENHVVQVMGNNTILVDGENQRTFN